MKITIPAFASILLLGMVQGRAQTSPPLASAPPQASARGRAAQVQLQNFLDRALFSPGKVDGLAGEFTTKAILRYQKAHGLEENGAPENIPVPTDIEPYTQYTIKPDDRKFVGSLPGKPEEQAHLHYLPYDSLLEFMTERFHCSEGLLAALNPGTNLERLKVGDTLKVPAVEPFQIEDIQAVSTLPNKPQFRKRSIYINRKERILELSEGEKLISSVPITPGSETLPTPPGKWRLLAIATMPSFRWDEGVLNHGVRTNQFFMLPPGPNNPVGVAWCALNRPGIGIHGTNQPNTIGRAHSHGCMRVANWDVVRLIDRITADIPVVIE